MGKSRNGCGKQKFCNLFSKVRKTIQEESKKMFVLFAVLVGLIPVIPAVVYVLQNGKISPAKALARLVSGFNAFNFILGMMAAGLIMVWLASPSAVMAAGMAQEGGADPY